MLDLGDSLPLNLTVWKYTDPLATGRATERNNMMKNSKSVPVESDAIVEVSSPNLVTMENVPQLAQHGDFQEFWKSLRDYHVWYSIVECSEYGVPQSRKRLVLMASQFGPIGTTDWQCSAGGTREVNRSIVCETCKESVGPTLEYRLLQMRRLCEFFTSTAAQAIHTLPCGRRRGSRERIRDIVL